MSATQPVKIDSPVVGSAESPHSSVPLRWSPVDRSDVLCSDRTIVDAHVDKLVVGVCAVAGHLDIIVDLVIEFAVFTTACWDTQGRDGTKIGGE